MASDKSSEVNAFLSQGRVGLTEALALAGSSSPRDTAILVALSGGVDSTALLIMLHRLKDEFNLSLFACHVNHHVRGEEADKDEEFCREICRRLNVPLEVEHLDPPTDESVSEEKLRQLRYECLAKVAKEKKINFVATAHIKDDQLETLLFRLFRGTGRPGLVGMPMARRLDDQVYLIRPFINISKSQCETFLESCGQSARFDSSNNNLAYRRNFIRHRVIPIIKEQFTNVAESMERFRNLNEEEEAFMSQSVDAAFAELSNASVDQWRRTRFTNLHSAIQRRVLWRALKFRHVEPSFERIEACRKAIFNQSAISLDETWDLRATGDTIFWQDKSQSQEQSAPWQVELKVPGTTPILRLNHALRIEELDEEVASFPPSGDLSAIADLSLVSWPLVVRTRMPGDTIQPFGMQEMVRLKTYLHNRKPEGGPNLFTNIVVADQKEVIWVPGIGLSNKLRVTEKPSHLLTWLQIATDPAIC